MVIYMEIIFSDKENKFNLDFKKNIILFGSNNSCKTKILKLLADSIKNGTAIINSLNIKKGDYDVLFFSEESDFNGEFSFTKSNVFRSTIYDSIMNSIDKNRLLEEINLTFDKLDKKVNNYLDKNLNLFFNNNIKFDINIDDLDNIINKFTSIYINDLNESKKIPKSFKRMLIYQLSLLNSSDKEKIIIIDDFDLYMDSYNIIQILDFISKFSSEQCHFILSTSNPLVYNYVNNNFDIYKITNQKLVRFSNISDLIKKGILMYEFEKSKDSINFNDFYNNNISLITDEDINLFYKEYFIYLKVNIGIILTNNFICFNDYSNKNVFIFTKNNKELYFLKFVCDALLTDYKIIDIL